MKVPYSMNELMKWRVTKGKSELNQERVSKKENESVYMKVSSIGNELRAMSSIRRCE